MNRIATLLLLALPLAAQDIPPAPAPDTRTYVFTEVVNASAYNVVVPDGTPSRAQPFFMVVPQQTNCIIGVVRPQSLPSVFTRFGTYGPDGNCSWTLTDTARAELVHALGGLMPSDVLPNTGGGANPPPPPVPTPQPLPSSYANYGVWSFLAQPSNDGLRALGAQPGDVIWTAVKNPNDPILRVDYWTVTHAGDTPSKPDGLNPVKGATVQ